MVLLDVWEPRSATFLVPPQNVALLGSHNKIFLKLMDIPVFLTRVNISIVIRSKVASHLAAFVTTIYVPFYLIF